MSRFVVAVLLASLAGLSGAADDTPAPKKADKPDVPPGFVAADTSPRWIWAEQVRDRQTAFFRQEVTVPANVRSVKLYGTCDDAMTVYVDGKEVASGKEWKTPVFQDVTAAFRLPMNRGTRGQHVVAVRAHNTGSSAGLLLRLVFEPRTGKSFALVTDDTWRVAEKAADDWKTGKLDEQAWVRATVVGKLGDKPWESITEKALTAAARLREPPATAPETLKVAKDFKVELLYSVPKEVQGSWVNLCVDPQGRLITSDQYGPLYRVTPPPPGGKADETKVEKIEAPIGEAQGLLWAFDSLYVVVNKGQKYESGLYRVRASHGDDRLDNVKLLRKIDGGGEHGPHAVLLAPDGKSLVVVCGDGTRPVAVGSSRVPRIWGEDHLLPRMPDGRGFMRDVGQEFIPTRDPLEGLRDAVRLCDV